MTKEAETTTPYNARREFYAYVERHEGNPAVADETKRLARQWVSAALADAARSDNKVACRDDVADAKRYRYLRERDCDTIHKGGIFAGMTPDNYVVSGEELDAELDKAMAS